MKRTAAAIITALMFVQLLAVSAFAETVYTEGTLYYITDDSSVTITGYFGKSETVYIPAVIAGLPVTSIAPGAFVDTSAVTVNLPSTIETIENGAIGQGVKLVYSEYTVVTTSSTPTPTDPPAGGGSETPSPAPTAEPPAPIYTPAPIPTPVHTRPSYIGGTTVIGGTSTTPRPTATPKPTPSHTPSPTVSPDVEFDVSEVDIDISELEDTEIAASETAEPAPAPTHAPAPIRQSADIPAWIAIIITPLLIIVGAVYFLLYKKRNKEDE